MSREKRLLLIVFFVLFMGLLATSANAKPLANLGTFLSENFGYFISGFGADLASGDAGAIALMKFLLWLLLFAILQVPARRLGRRSGSVAAAVISIISVIIIPKSVLVSIAQSYGVVFSFLMLLLPILIVIIIYSKIDAFIENYRVRHLIKALLTLLLIIAVLLQGDVLTKLVSEGSWLTLVSLVLGILFTIHIMGFFFGEGAKENVLLRTIDDMSNKFGASGSGSGGSANVKVPGGEREGRLLERLQEQDAQIELHNMQLDKASEKYEQSLQSLSRTIVSDITNEEQIYERIKKFLLEVSEHLSSSRALWEAIQNAQASSAASKALADKLADLREQFKVNLEGLQKQFLEFQQAYQKLFHLDEDESNNVNVMLQTYADSQQSLDQKEKNLNVLLADVSAQTKQLEKVLKANRKLIGRKFRKLSPEDQKRITALIEEEQKELERLVQRKESLTAIQSDMKNLRDRFNTLKLDLDALKSQVEKTRENLRQMEQSMSSVVQNINTQSFMDAVSRVNALSGKIPMYEMAISAKKNLIGKAEQSLSEIENVMHQVTQLDSRVQQISER